MKILTSREFNQDVSQAKRFAKDQPVFVTDRGRPTHVLLSIEAFRELTGPSESVVDLLAMPEAPAIDADPAGAWDRHESYR